MGSRGLFWGPVWSLLGILAGGSSASWGDLGNLGSRWGSLRVLEQSWNRRVRLGLGVLVCGLGLGWGSVFWGRRGVGLSWSPSQAIDAESGYATGVLLL